MNISIIVFQTPQFFRLSLRCYFTSMLLTPLFSYGEIVGAVEVFSVLGLGAGDEPPLQEAPKRRKSASQSISLLLLTLHLTKKDSLNCSKNGDHSLPV